MGAGISQDSAEEARRGMETVTGLRRTSVSFHRRLYGNYDLIYCAHQVAWDPVANTRNTAHLHG